MGFWIAWMVVTMAAGYTRLVLGIMIVDEIEANLPIEERPSWRVSLEFRHRRPVLPVHRRMYPKSRLRKFAVAANVIFSILILGPFVWAIVRS